MRIPSGTTDQVIYFVAVDSTDFTTRETGLSSFTVYRSRDGATAAAMTSPTVTEVDATNMPGVYKLLLDEDMTIASGNDSEEMAFHITQASMAPVTRTIELYRPKITVGNTLDVTSTGAAGIDWANVENASTSVDLSATAINLCDTVTTNTDMRGTDSAFLAASAPTNFGDLAITASTGRVTVGTNNDKTGYSISGTLTTLDALDTQQDSQHSTTQSAISALNDPSAATTAAAVWDAVQSSHVTAGSFGVIASEIADILADTNELQTDDVPGLIAALNDLDAAGVRTAVGLASANLDTQLTAIDTVVDAVLVDTAEIGTAGAGLTAVPWNAAWDAEVQSECTDALNAYDGPTNTEMVAAFTEIKGATWATTDTLEAIRDRGDAAWTTGAGGTPPQLLQNTTIATLASQTSFTLTAGSADDDAYNGAVVVVTDQSTSTQKAVGSVSDYVGSTKTITLSSDPGIFTMAAGDTIDVIANASTAPSAAAVRAEIDSNSTQLAAIVADTNELQADWADGGRLDLILDARASQTSVNTIDGIVDAILVDTGTTLPASIATAQADLDTITGSDGVTLASIQSNYTPATAAELANTDSSVSTLATLIGTAQADLDILTGSDGAILATTQSNYAPATAASVAALNDLSAADVNAEVLDVIATDTLIDGRTIQSALRIIGAAAIGKLSGAGTSSEVFVGLDGSTTRATVTADASGNRTQVIYV